MIGDDEINAGLSGIARVTELFREADRLDAAAYSSLGEDTSQEARERFASMKVLADQKYMEARIELARIKEQVDKDAQLFVRHLY